MNRKTLLSLAAAAALFAAPVFGQTVLFQHDFSTSGADGMPDPAVWTYDGRSPNIDSNDQDANKALGKYIEVTDANAGALFGNPGNSYLRHAKESTTGSLWITANNRFSSGSTVVTVEFNFHMPSETTWETANPTGEGPRVRLGINDPIASNANRVPNEIRFGQGGAGAISGVSGVFSMDTTHAIRIVYNHSSQEVGYVDSSLTVPASSYDVWIDGVRVMAGAGGATDWLAADTPLTSIGIGSFNNHGSEFFMDDLVVYANAIPEPSAYALGAGFMALLIAALVRRNRRRPLQRFSHE